MDTFTAEETARINELHATNFENATPEDYALITRWEKHWATESAIHDEKVKILKEELETRTIGFIRQTLEAVEALDELKEAALARLKAVE